MTVFHLFFRFYAEYVLLEPIKFKENLSERLLQDRR